MGQDQGTQEAMLTAYFHLFNAVIKEGQASVLITDKGALFDEANKNLSLGQLRVKLLMGTVPAL